MATHQRAITQPLRAGYEPAYVTEILGYSDGDTLAAAEYGAKHGDDLGAQLVETVCAAYVSLVQDGSEELRQLREQLAAERDKLAAEQRLNADLRYQLAELRGGDTVVVEVSYE